ncbi:beta-xylosidase [Novosphingobium sediminicola]|uniref:Beta-xylosidase n=2 Tax=Novosphingobium sediminicola TaxID=563162 RepID=A0A7W6CHE6_9SPHN|nr:beta-xylosidase [Novosphingobium sediminicola]
MSSAYEELGVADYVLKEGDMGYGTMIHQIPKVPFNTYKLMHELGDTRLAAEGPALASRRADGSIATLIWNLAEVQQPSGIPGVARTHNVTGEDKSFLVKFEGAAGKTAKIQFVDQQRGSPLPAWRAMGSPQYPRADQLAALRKAAEMAAPITVKLDVQGALTLPAEGVALITLAWSEPGALYKRPRAFQRASPTATPATTGPMETMGAIAHAKALHQRRRAA